MTLYELRQSELKPIANTTFAEEQFSERGDLQRLLRDQPEVLEQGLFVVAEEFGNWADSRRRIDLLCVDTESRLVVVELKRTDDGGHAELQAIRYAAMVANMTVEQVVEAHRAYLEQRGILEDAEERLRTALGVESLDDANVKSRQPRILLASADFSRELTTSVLWLNDTGGDIRCLRLQPYQFKDTLLVDVTQVIPLPESEDYLVRVKEKAAEEDEVRRAEKSERMQAYQSFFADVLGALKGRAPDITSATKTQAQSWFGFASGHSAAYFAWAFTRERRFKVELTVDTPDAATNRTIIEHLTREREAIASEVRAPLELSLSDKRRAQRIQIFAPDPITIEATPEGLEDLQEWAADTMVRFVRAIRPRLATAPFP